MTFKDVSIEIVPILLLPLALVSTIIFSPNVAFARDNFDKDVYSTLIEESDRKIEERRRRKERDEERLKQYEESRKLDEARKNRPLFGSSERRDDDNDDKIEGHDNKIFNVSMHNRNSDKRLRLNLREDVDYDERLESMKHDKLEDKEKDEEDKKRREKEDDKRKDIRDERNKELWDKLIDRADTIMDWVPGDADPTNNGGFAAMDGNGRPVPYTLNGHPDLQRKRPWAHDD